MIFALLTMALSTTGCITGIRAVENPNRAFDLPESDAVLIEWQECSEVRPCMRGDWEGKDYALGFRQSPSLVVGTLGTERIELSLEPSSVFSYGNSVVEMTFSDKPKTTVLAVTWNERDQLLIDAQLVQSDK